MNTISIHRLTTCGLNGNMPMRVSILVTNCWLTRLYKKLKHQLRNFVLIVHCIITFCLICSVTFHWILRMIIAGWQPEQAKPQEVWDFLITELNDIKDKCGNEVKMGEINNYAVHMILAKMYLNHNAWFNDHSDDSYYQKCIDELNQVLAGPFSLAPNYSDNLRKIFLRLRKLFSAYHLNICMQVVTIMLING